MASIQYAYQRTGNYPGNVVGAWHAGLARHHILSFPFMCSFAVVTFWYIATHQNDAASYAKAKLDAFYKARGGGLNGWFTLCARFNKEGGGYLGAEVQGANSILNWICWAESNLFIGPAAIYRTNDPSQKMDQIPLSMGETEKGKAVMDKATDVKKAWDDICKSSIVGEDGQPISLSINDGGLPNFVKVFVDYICLSEPNVIYRSKYKDWAANLSTDTAGNTPHQFWINTKKAGDVIKEERYRFAIRNQEAGANEPWVRITTFNDKDVLGVKAGNPGSNCGDNPF